MMNATTICDDNYNNKNTCMASAGEKEEEIVTCFVSVPGGLLPCFFISEIHIKWGIQSSRIKVDTDNSLCMWHWIIISISVTYKITKCSHQIYKRQL